MTLRLYGLHKAALFCVLGRFQLCGFDFLGTLILLVLPSRKQFSRACLLVTAVSCFVMMGVPRTDMFLI
jgi:hypothetical protein